MCAWRARAFRRNVRRRLAAAGADVCGRLAADWREVDKSFSTQGGGQWRGCDRRCYRLHGDANGKGLGLVRDPPWGIFIT